MNIEDIEEMGFTYCPQSENFNYRFSDENGFVMNASLPFKYFVTHTNTEILGLLSMLREIHVVKYVAPLA